MDSFVKKIRILVEECRFTNPDEHIIDSLIFGSNSKCTQAKLLDKDTTLSLDTALDIARTEEATSNQIKEITPDSSTRVDALKHGGLPDKPCGPTIRLCGCCGTEHDISERRFCPAYGSKCGACTTRTNKNKPPKIQPYRPCAKSLCMDGLKRSDCPAYLHAYCTVMSSL